MNLEKLKQIKQDDRSLLMCIFVTVFIMWLVTITSLSIVISKQNSKILSTLDNNRNNIEICPDTIANIYELELNKENFIYVCAYYDIEHPDIVYAQAQLESGHFTSRIFNLKNNFLGLYDSKNKDYYGFKHWSDCLKGYRDFVQYKWDKNEDYYSFLTNLPYAADPNYIKKVKFLVTNN